MNTDLSNFSNCAQLELEEIHEGRITLIAQKQRIYEVRFQTIPGAGIFGVEIMLEVTRNSAELKFPRIGKIERQNMYGNQSACHEKEMTVKKDGLGASATAIKLHH
jgi:hypothetical protein